MIQLKNVVKTFPAAGKNKEITALKEISLEIEKGDIFGIVGYSGAGKSTLLRLLNGLETPTRGTVLVDGKESGILRLDQDQPTLTEIGIPLTNNAGEHEIMLRMTGSVLIDWFRLTV